MSTIDQKGQSSNPANETTDTSSERSGEETASASEQHRGGRVRLTIPAELIREGNEAVERVGEIMDIRRAKSAGDDGNGEATGNDDGEHPAPSSLLAVRADGALLMSLEDAADRDLTGRTLVTFLVLNDVESATARARVAGEAGEAAAHLIAHLPKRKP